MKGEAIVKKGSGKLSAAQQVELEVLARRVRERLHRSAEDILAIGADLIQAKALVGHGRFGEWLDREFSLSRRSAEQFMGAARRFGGKSEAISHLPAGAVLELSAPSVPDEFVARVLSGEIEPSHSAIRAERSGQRSADRSYAVGGTFIEHLERFHGTGEDFAASIAAHVLRRWKEAKQRKWFGACMWIAGEMIDDNVEAKIPPLELPRTTVRRLRDGHQG